MIKFKLNPLSNKYNDLEYSSRNTIRDYIYAIEDKYSLTRGSLEKYTSVHIDGQKLDNSFYQYVMPKDNAIVTIVVVPQGSIQDNLGPILTIIAITVISAYTGGGGAILFGSQVATQIGLSLAATFAINALFPPPGLDSPSNGAGPSAPSESQTYSITGQSNQIKPYGIVPRVYGTHRMFPSVVANPYVEIETDSNGKSVQYFYAIYDFGFGPNNVSEIKIGETLLEDYSDYTIRLVDPNRPASNEGAWDEQLSKTFDLYKGDVVDNPISFTLSDGGSAISTGANNPDNIPQEYTVQFNLPRGLATFTTAGSQVPLSIECEIDLREEGTTEWFPYTDPDKIIDVYDNFNFGDIKVDKKYINLLYKRWIDRKPVDPRVIGGNWRNWYFQYWSFGLDSINSTRLMKIGYQNPNSGVFTVLCENQPPDGISFYIGGNFVGLVQGLHPDQTETNGLVRIYIVVQTTSRFYIGFDYGITKGVSPSPATVTDFSRLQSQWFLDFNNTTPSTVTSITLSSRDTGNKYIISSNTKEPLYTQLKIRTKNNVQHDIRVRRIRTIGRQKNSLDQLVWSNVRTRLDRSPINTKYRHTFLELRIKASDQLNGAIDKMNAVISSVLPIYDQNTQTWSLDETSNPAWVYCDMLSGDVNKKKIDKLKIDTDSIVEWANYCEEIPATPSNWAEPYYSPRYKTDFILDYKTTIREILNNVCSAAGATINIVDGKYGVLIDKQKNIPVQMFTTRNSRDFQMQRSYTKLPDGIKVKFIDPQTNWQQNEMILYYDGFNDLNAENFEDFEAFACTTPEQAFRFGKYLQAQSLLRQETCSITVDFENLVANRGDLVYLQQDSIKLSGQPARVTSVTNVNTITINDSFFDIGILPNEYGYTLRKSDGTIVTDQLNIIDSDTAELINGTPEIGDLLIWGELSSIVSKWIIKSISALDNLEATLVLIEYNEEIYTSESDDFLPNYNPDITEIPDNVSVPPSEVPELAVGDQVIDCNGSSYVYSYDLSWSSPTGVFENFEVYVSVDKAGYALIDVVDVFNYTYIIKESQLGLEHRFKVIAVNSLGTKLSLGQVGFVAATPFEKSTPPGDVDAIYLNVTNETIQINWDLLEDCDILNYLVRFTPLTDGSANWDTSSPLLTVNAKTSSGFAQARTGTYLVKAVDFGGRESVNAARAITSIPNLVEVNAVDIIEDPNFIAGGLDRVTTFSNSLVLENTSITSPPDYRPEGFYYLSRLLDLGEVFTIRLQANIIASGFSDGDVMQNWPDLINLDAMSSATGADYQVDLEYRSRDSVNTMDTWGTLDNVASLTFGNESEWTDWRRFTIGDFTGRIFAFRIRMRSYKASITPRVFEAKVIADMTDRTIRGNDIIAPIGGLRVNFNPAFYGPLKPNVQITQDDATEGDKFTITNKGPTGFDIEFFNGGISVSRQFDYAALGYGKRYSETI